MDDYYLIGKIVSVYKNNGFVKVLSYSDFPGRFHNLKKVFMDFFDDMKEFQIENIKELTVPDIIYIKFRNFNTAGEAANLVGRSIFVDKNDLVKLPENVFFIHDLIGSRVFRKGELFGFVTDVFNSPANDVFVVKTVS
ncbi:MAG: ribosome maturation factor RimM, partial [Ignavibacteria bacterium]